MLQELLSCHPDLVYAFLPEHLGTVPQDSCAAARAVVGSLKLSARSRDEERHPVAGFVPVTRAQWVSVLRDSDLPALQRHTDEVVAEILRVRTESGRIIGRQLPGLLRRLKAFVDATDSAAREVSRFRPPRPHIAEQRLVTDLAKAIRRESDELFTCAAQGWDELSWSVARRHSIAAQAAACTLDAAARTDQSDAPEEDVYQRTLGLSAGRLNRGSGAAWKARLLAAWVEDPKGFERRLRRNMRHLIDDSVPLTDKLGLHLATLALSDRPLLAHRVTLQTRALVTSRLQADREQTSSAIARDGDREPEALFAHRSQAEYAERYNRAEHHEEQARAAMDFYRAVLEGDVKRTSMVVLELLGRTVPEVPTVTTVRDLLKREAEPLCGILASTIRTEWRNANAHEEFRWDPIGNVLVLRGQPADLKEILDVAVRAHAICRAFEHGVAAAYAQNASLVTRRAEPNYVSRDLSILAAFGLTGVAVDDLRRRGTTLRLDVPDLTISTLREACRAVLRGAEADPQVECWELRQTSRDLPALILNRAGVSAGLRVAGSLWEGLDLMPFAELPMLANALTNAGEPPQLAASTVVTFAAAHVVGERDRLAADLARLGRDARAELLSTVSSVSAGAEAAAHLLENPGRHQLLVFAQMLTGGCDRVAKSSPSELARGFASASHTLRIQGPVRVPWIKEIDDLNR